MGTWVWATMLVVLAVTGCQGHPPREGKLTVFKNIAHEKAYVGHDLPIEVRVFNVGKGPAYNVEVDDAHWSADLMEFVVGEPTVSWDVIEPGQNLTHVYVVRPRHSGGVHCPPTRVEYYRKQRRGGPPQFATSNDPKAVTVLPQSEGRNPSKLSFEWAMFGLMAAVPILVPFVWWQRLRNVDDSKAKRA